MLSASCLIISALGDQKPLHFTLFVHVPRTKRQCTSMSHHTTVGSCVNISRDSADVTPSCISPLWGLRTWATDGLGRPSTGRAGGPGGQGGHRALPENRRQAPGGSATRARTCGWCGIVQDPETRVADEVGKPRGHLDSDSGSPKILRTPLGSPRAAEPRSPDVLSPEAPEPDSPKPKSPAVQDSRDPEAPTYALPLSAKVQGEDMARNISQGGAKPTPGMCSVGGLARTRDPIVSRERADE